MKFIVASAVLALSPLAAGAAPSMMQVQSGFSSEIGHSGGCRKDSPAGQCCHAGSQPYHCH